MNWCGMMIQARMSPNWSVLDLGCGIMQATLDTCPSYQPSKLQCKDLTGVDVYQPYLDLLDEKGIKTVNHDLTKLPLPFPDKSVDVVLLTDVLEHMPTMEAATGLYLEAERIARKRVFILTPKVFQSNVHGVTEPFPYTGLGENEYQLHHVLITKDWLDRYGLETVRIFNPKNEEAKSWFAIKYLQPRGLRILHVWDQAGVSCLMAQEQRRLGHEASVMKLAEFSGGFMEYYGFTEMMMPRPEIDPTTPVRKAYSRIPESLRSPLRTGKRKLRSLKFLWKVRDAAKDYDFLHVHSLWLLMFLMPFKKKILEFHGDDMRKYPSFLPRWKRLFTRLFIRLYTLFAPIFVSTPDLLSEGFSHVVYIPNPVDLQHFKRQHNYEPNTALYTRNWHDYDSDHASKIAEKYGWKLTIQDRVDSKDWMPHTEFPRYLEQFEIFIDRKTIPSLSKTALESLALGMKVVNWKGEILEGLPSQHYAENVAKTTLKIYRKVIHNE